MKRLNQLLKDKLSLLPMNPGCYLMKDAKGQVIYVGKAKRLKNQLINLSFFHRKCNSAEDLICSNFFTDICKFKIHISPSFFKTDLFFLKFDIQLQQ